MNLWHKKISVFVLAGAVYLAGQYFRGVWFLGSIIPNTCGHAEAGGVPFCNSPYLDTLGWPLIVLGQMLAAAAVILLFANAAAFRRFIKFSIFYVPIATALTLWIYPFTFGLGFTLHSVIPISAGVGLFGEIYVLITLGIVLYSWWKERRVAKKLS